MINIDAPVIAEESRVTVQVRGLSLTVSREKSLLKKVKGKEGREKRILWNVSCDFRPGKLTAVMGSSGAGKTSLLKLVAGDNPELSNQAGCVLMNGQPASAQEIKNVSAFVFHDDVLLPTMTAKGSNRDGGKAKGQDAPVDGS